MKNGEIILCKGIKMDKGFENVLSYNESDMVTLCRNNAVATTTKYSILDPSVRSIDVAVPYSTCIPINYIAFKNPYYGNKWYFAFVEDIVYVNNNTTTIKYKLDVFSTWYPKMNVGQAFVEREHVSDDTIGNNTVPEGLDTGEYIVNEVQSIGYETTGNPETRVVIGVTKVPEDMWSTFSTTSRSYNGIFNGLSYYVFETFPDAANFLSVMDLKGLAENVVNVFLAPNKLCNTSVFTSYTETIIDWGSTTFDITFSYNKIPNESAERVLKDSTTIVLNSTLNGYTPKNNKMFTKEFNFLHITNNNGGDVNYAYEDFVNNTPTYRVIGAICPGCSIRLIPENYKKYTTSSTKNILMEYGLVAGKYPVCSWRSDTYTNWLTQNSVNYTMDRIGTIGAIGVAAAINPAVAAISGVGLITDLLKEKEKREKSPIQSKGNVNVGDVTYSSGMNKFTYSKMSCRYEYAKKIDEYFSRFGYQVNEIKTPNLLSRTKFNFIKVGGLDELVHGDIPASDLEEINNIFRKGVTIFHDYSTFGNYTQTNAIVTP